MAFSPTFQRPFSATFDRRVAAAGNGLLNALIAYWPGNEASGNLLDAHSNALHLYDVNAVTNAAGKVYPTARQYRAANYEAHRASDNALLSAADTDFTFAAWIYLDSRNVAQFAIDKSASISVREYSLNVLATNLMRWRVFNGASTAIADVSASTFGALSAATWYLVVSWHDATANQIAIQINDTAANVAATSGAPGDTDALFSVGSFSGLGDFWNGRIGPVAFWKSAAGAGGVLSSSQRSALYNGGAGLAYAQFTT